jgi:osmotically-inducible protein OsmY
MANGPYSHSGGYRDNRSKDQQEFSRGSSDDYRSREAGYQRGFGDHESSQGDSGDRHFSRGNDDSRYGTSQDWARDEYGYNRSFGDDDRSRAWARESYRANPSSFSYQPSERNAPGASRERFGRGSDYNAFYGRSDDRDRRGSDNGDQRSFMNRATDEVRSWFGDEHAEQRRAMDEHRGKGPKGYQRSDARIEEDVNDRLSDDPVLDASNVSVTVKDGEVTLDGSVTSRWDKRRAEDVVDGVSGVRHVQNNLRVNASPADPLAGSTTI